MKKLLGFFAVAAILLPMQAVAQEPTVARGQFTSAVLDREPVDEVQSLDVATDRVLFFTELLNMEGKTITHRWEHDGAVQAEISFQVGGPRWRVYSSKQLTPEWVGKDWVVTIVDDINTVYSTHTLGYAGASAETAPAAAEPAAESTPPATQ